VQIIRQKSKNDCELQKIDNSFLVVSVDMEKVLQFPKLRTDCFVEKFSFYNETFAQLGDNSKAVCYVSHECEIDAKKANEITNIYFNFMRSEMCENIENLIIKCDNSCAQNKCWCLYSNLIGFINDISVNIKCIDYYETGYSFQAVDNVHALTSQSLKRTPNVYNFQHLCVIIENSRDNTSVKFIKYSDVFQLKYICKKSKF
jgi:hypothetical protein